MLSTAGTRSLINYQNALREGFTPLYIAAQEGHAAATKQLIEARCNVDLQDEHGCTPLFIAAEKGDAAVTELLIAARCNVDLQDKDGCTPLHDAAENGHSSVTEMLIEARCNVNHEDKDGWTPLFFAAHNGHVSVTKQLIEALCNVDAQKNGVSPLHCAAGKGHASVTHLLIQTHCNSNIDLQREDGCTALCLAAQNGHAGVANQLIEARCSIDVPNVHGMTALHAAERMGHTAIATLIRNTRQKIAESIVRQAEEERLGLVALLAAVPQEDWCRTWAACRTIMLRRTSKSVKEQVDKMRLPAVVLHDRRSTWPNSKKLEIVMNQLPLMTAWCRLTTLEVHGLCDCPRKKNTRDLCRSAGRSPRTVRRIAHAS